MNLGGSKRFPQLSWAWPTGDLDLLIRAAADSDAGTALQAARQWLASNEIDAVTFREHRLLAAVSERFGRELKDAPASPRLAGLQRLLWTRSQLALREARPVLTRLLSSGVRIMLLKGAARLAVDPPAARSRISHDIDILVPHSQIFEAFDCLTDMGWQPATGVSACAVRHRLTSIRAVNFLRGEYGDVDLHQQGYHPLHADPEDDEAVWERAEQVEFAGNAVLAPSAADRLAMSIAHGSLDAHVHSDWLIDCHAATQCGNVDWATFVRAIRARQLGVEAGIALTYLVSALGSNIPEDVTREVMRSAYDRSMAHRVSVLVQARPRDAGGRLSNIARGIAKLRRPASSISTQLPSEIVFSGRRSLSGLNPIRSRSTLRSAIELSVSAPVGDTHVKIVLDCHLSTTRRRIEFELRSGSEYLARLSYRNWDGLKGWRRLVFEGTIRNSEAAPLTLEARPLRNLRPNASENELRRYGAVPFCVAKCDLGPI